MYYNNIIVSINLCVSKINILLFLNTYFNDIKYSVGVVFIQGKQKQIELTKQICNKLV